MRNSPLSTDSQWTFELIQRYDEEIAIIAKEFKLDTYPIQIEVISSEQMMDVYSTVGMPLGYNHWSFGKQFVNIEKNYKHGFSNLAYEIVINSNPCIAYLLEENSIIMQAMVIAHACYGHNSFFKGNYLFKTWTDADSIIDYLLFARNFVRECEERHGIDAVEDLLDSCHALMNYGVDRYKRPPDLSLIKEKARQKAREAYLQSQVNDLWRTIPEKKGQSAKEIDEENFPAEPQENLLYFVEKNAPLLEPWQREIIRITRKIAQYFYPQKQTKVMNEGWASFWHYTIMNRLYEKGLTDDKFMLEFLHNHTNLIRQPDFDDPQFSGLNPYTLGFHLFADIRRICENPTEEDKQWFPDLAGTDWLDSLHNAMSNFKDESFIAQYLSPHLIRQLKLFTVLDNDENKDLLVSAIHDESGYQAIRAKLAEQYNLSQQEPNIQIYHVDLKGDRSINLRHYQHDRKPLNDDSDEVLKHFHRLWAFDVCLETVDQHNKVLKTYHCPQKEQEAKTLIETKKDGTKS